MKRLFTILSIICIAITGNAQNTVLQREAPLMPEDYSITGTAFLEELDNGNLQLRISENYSTPNGPDVRIFLNNSVSLAGAVEIADISDLGYFSGAMTFQVPAGITIDQYDNIIFYCVAFNQFWASGIFGPVTSVGGFNCEESTVSTSSGINNVDICPSDGSNDIISFTNSLGANAANYAYLITDENEILQEVIMSDVFNFEGSTDETQRVYGIHYDGDLQASIGSNRLVTTATECHTHSSFTAFVTITKNACPPPFECFISNVFTSSNQSSIDICPTDGNPDIVFLDNNINETPGDHYAYLITDNNELLQEVILSSDYNFEGSSLESQRVYGVHFDGSLLPMLNSPRTQTSATGCFTHSSSTNYLTVFKNACPPVFDCMSSNVTTLDGESTVEICPMDNESDIVDFANSLSSAAGDHYAYIITDENEIAQEIITEASFDFESTSSETQRVYGIHYDGVLTQAIGQDRSMTTATECFEHSNAGAFITIHKTGCPPPFECLSTEVSNANGESSVTICPTDGMSDVITFTNNEQIEVGDNFTFLITDANEVLISKVEGDSYDFEGSSSDEERIYAIHYSGELNLEIGLNRMMTTASDCFEHSSSEEFLQINKGSCPPIFECISTLTATTDWATMVDICPSDGIDDIIELRNNISAIAGEHYAYLITNSDEVVMGYTLDSMYNFEGSSPEEQRVYGVHYDGVLNVKMGEDRMNTEASGCFEHSGANLFLTITKAACPPVEDCIPTLTATTNWATEAIICTFDGEDDIVELRNNEGIEVGSNYAYLLTDANEILQEVVFDTFYNFEGTLPFEQRVYGIHFDGTLDAKIGEHRLETSASECFEHSGDNLFLKISKSACNPDFECVESLTAGFAWQTEIDICTTDAIDDEILIQNNIDTPPGQHYAFIMTDTNEVLIDIFFDSLYNFEGTGIEDVRIYGMSYSGEIVPAFGEDRKNTSATHCFEHSGDNLFITIYKTAACATSTENEQSISEIIKVYPNPSNGILNIDRVDDQNIISIEVLNLQGQLIKTVTSAQVEIVNSGIYFLRIKTTSGMFSQKISVVR